MTRQEQRQASSRKMLDAALGEFAENGYSAGKIANIAKNAGVASGLVSQRFGTKEDLYCAVIEDLLERYKQITEEGNLAEILIKLGDAIREGARDRSDAFTLLSNHFSGIDIPSACDTIFRKEYEGSRLGVLMARAVNDGTVMDGDPYDVFSNYLRTSLFLCKNCVSCSMSMPTSADLLRIIRYRVDSEADRLALFNFVGASDSDAESIILKCSKLITEDREPEYCINSFLEYIGGYYKASRVYVFEVDSLREGVCSEYEWAAEGTVTQSPAFSKGSAEKTNRWMKALSTDGQFYISAKEPEICPHPELLADIIPLEIDSVMGLAIVDHGRVSGGIFVDDPRNNVGNMYLLKSVTALGHGELLRAIKNSMDKSRSLALISSLASDYDCACYIDEKNNTVTKIRLIPELEKLLERIDPLMPSNLRFDAFLRAMIHPEDLSGFIASVDREKVIQALTVDQACTSYFRIILNGETLHYAVKIVKDMSSLSGYLVGFKNVEKEYQADTREERRGEVMKLLSSQYTAMYYVDFVAQKFEVFSLSDRIKDDTGEMLKGTSSISDAFTKFVRASVHPEDQKDMIDCLKSVRQRLAHNKAFSFPFRRNYGGEYLYTEMKVVKINGENEPATAVALGFAVMDDMLHLRNEQEKTIRSGIEVLYGTPDAKVALTELMKLVRDYHDSDCAYIFELNRDRTRIRMSYEWVYDELEPIVDQAENEPVEARALWFKAFETKGEFVVNSVEDEIDHDDPAYVNLVEEEVDSFMCVPLITNGEITGFIGVDNAGFAQGNLLILRCFAALVSSEILRRKQSDEEHILLDKVTSNYNSVYFADLSNDHIRNYIISDEYHDRYVGVTSYDKYIEECMINDVCDEDCPKFRRMTSREYIASQFALRDSFTINFIDDSTDVRKNFEMRIIKANADGSQIVISTRDTSEAVLHEKKLQEAQQEQLEILVAERTMELQEKNMVLNRVSEDIIELLGNITEARDSDSGRHIRRVKGFTHILAEQVMNDWPEYELDDDTVALMTSASALHDVGKIMIPDAILLKPGRLTPEEFTIMKSHCSCGCDILKNAPTDWSADYLKMSMDICHYHHEKYDGSGYPEGLVGDDIPISAQIVAVADCFDALTTKRVYKDAIPAEDAISMIYGGECGVFSGKILSSLKHCEGAFLKNVEGIEKIYTQVPNTVGERSGLAGTKILFAEGNELIREVCTEILEGEGAIVTAVSNGREAVDLFTCSAPGMFDAILMDIKMPEMNGVEATMAIRETSSPIARTIPIIAVCGSDEQKDVEACLKAGMNDFINKPVTVSSLTRVLLGCMRDQSDALLEQLNMAVKMANKDPLTGVKNMTAYTDMIASLTESIRKDPQGVNFALVECDINNLKQVNDNYGHDVGDIYIKNCSSLICGVFKHSPVFRIGGDEFVVILRDGDYEKRDALMLELNRRVAAAEKLPDAKRGKVSLAAGIGVFDPDLDDGVSTVFRRADGSMYNRKHMMKLAGGTSRG